MAEQTIAVRPKTDVGDDSTGSPGYTSARVIEQTEAARVVRDTYKGTAHMRAQGRRYMPQWGPKEDGGYTESDRAYADRVSKAKLFNGTRKTVKGLTGMVFRKPIQLSEVPEAITPHLENIDLAGRSLAAFARDGFDDKVQSGHGLIFVDWHDPESRTNAAGIRTAADESEARPYWAWIEKEQVRRFRTRKVQGKPVLEMFAYEEFDTVPDGEFGEKHICRVRQYELVEEGGAQRVQHRSWTRDADSEGQWGVEDKGTLLGDRMDEIPLRVDYANRTGFMTSEPPLADLATENIGHWQLRSERDHSLHVGSVPIWVITGMSKEQLGDNVVAMGTSIGLCLPDPDADAGYKETSGGAYEATRNELQDTEQRMAALGLSVLVRKSRVQRTAEENRTERAEHDSELAAFAEATSEALTGALELHAKWMGVDGGGAALIPTDFDPQPLDAQTLAILVGAVGSSITLDTLWDIMEAGEILPESFDRDVERQRLEEAGVDELRTMIQAMRNAGSGGDGDGGTGGEGDGNENDGGDDE